MSELDRKRVAFLEMILNLNSQAGIRYDKQAELIGTNRKYLNRWKAGRKISRRLLDEVFPKLEDIYGKLEDSDLVSKVDRPSRIL